MANPQVEQGHLKIASELLQAIRQTDLTGLQLRIILTVMELTYGVGKLKAEISIEDLKLLLGTQNLRPNRIAKALDDLIAMNMLFRQELSSEKQILGVQKDFDRWNRSGYRESEQNVHTSSYITSKHKATSSEQNVRRLDTVPGQLLTYLQEKLGTKFSLSVWRVEYSRARKLYAEALEKSRDTREALYALKDYSDYLLEDEWFRENVNFPCGYMLTRFERWYKHQPKKPKSVQSDEQALGRRMRFNSRTRNWEVTNERIQPDNSDD